MYFVRAPRAEISALLPPKPKPEEPRPNPFKKEEELTYEPIKPGDEGSEGAVVSY